MLGIWICGCSLFYKRELWASKSAGARSNRSLKISGCKRGCPKNPAPFLTHSLNITSLSELGVLTAPRDFDRSVNLMPITSLLGPFGFSDLPTTLWNKNATSKTISPHYEAEVHLFPAIADNAVCCSHCSINKHCFAKIRISLISIFSSLPT